MKTVLVPSAVRRVAAFTMVELALCIAIVAFAMVAILGVLPLGLSVQKQNREETIIDQEGPMWLEVIRRGGIGWDELTNYIDSIVIEQTPVNRSGATRTFGFRGPFFPPGFPVPAPGTTLATAEDVVSLLSIPRFEADKGTILSNRVTAISRSFSGDFNSQIRPNGTASFTPEDRQIDDALRYQFQVEITPVTQLPTLGVSPTNAVARAGIILGGYLNALRLDTNLVSELNDDRNSQDLFAATLYDVKLVFRWPVFRVGEELTVGPGQRVLRTQMYGKPRFARIAPNNNANIENVYWPGTSIRPRRFDSSAVNRVLTQ
ncbi:MAG: hypothetical protein J0M24_15940 [Verrucomicrobia bacterium]|nr:hypothetical protein [Verrucomicrobiota bacterium]